MNKVIQIFSVFLLFLLICSINTGCKKGENDPFISLRTRKARVAGDWKITKMEGTSSETFAGNTYSCIEEFDGSTYSKICDSNNPILISGEWTLSFKKDGSFSGHLEFVQDQDKITMDWEGTWTFLSGVGDKKRKEQLAVTTTSSSAEFTSSVGSPFSTIWTGKDRAYQVWDIKSLKEKEMVWYLQASTTNVNSASSATYTVTLTKN